MTADSATPVWNMPLPGHLPTGMPLPRDPGVTVVHHGPTEPRYVKNATGTGLTIVFDEGTDEHLKPLDTLFEKAFGECLAYLPARASFSGRASVYALTSREDIVRRVEALRSDLALTADEAAAVAGVKTRRFYDLVRGEPFPEGRLAEISDRFRIVSSLAKMDRDTMLTLLRDRPDETIEFLNDGRLGDLRQLFTQTRAHRAAVFAAEHEPDLRDQVAAQATAVLNLFKTPAFDVAAKILAWVGRTDRTDERGPAVAELLGVFRALDEDGQVGERWDFVYGLHAEERRALNDRAAAYIRSDDFTAAGWDTFLETESARAWASNSYAPLEPLPPVGDGNADEPQLSWYPDLDEISAGFEPYVRPR